MSQELSHLVIKHILPHLFDKQVDQLRGTNVSLNQMIEKRRLELPRFHMNWLEIHQMEEGWKQLCFQNTEKNYQRVEMEDSKLAKNLETVQVEDLELIGSSACGLLGKEWLRTITRVKVSEIADEKAVEDFVKKLKCSKLSLFHNNEEMNGSELIQNLPYIQELQLEKCNFSLEFFELLAKKTHAGPGIEYLNLKDWNEQPFIAEHLVNFIKNGKFNPDKMNYIRIEPRLDEDAMFGLYGSLFELGRLNGFQVMEAIANEIEERYEIRTPTGKVDLILWLE